MIFNIDGNAVEISIEDLDLMAWEWCKAPTQKYVSKGVKVGDKYTRYYLHREILSRMLGRPLQKGELVDHINGDPLDNRRSNLRLCSNAQNQYNRGKNRTNRTGYKGVTFVKRLGKFKAQIEKDGKNKYLGLFDCPKKAHEAYKEEAIKLHGEFYKSE